MPGSAPAGGQVLDILRAYTGPRGALVAAVFVVAALIRIPTVLLTVVVFLLERAATRLLAWANEIPPQPVPRRVHPGRSPR